METSLAALVPPRRFYDRYIKRDMGGITDVEMIERAIRTQDRLSGGSLNVLLKGPTGPGKTSLYQAVCAKNEWPLGTVNLNGQTTAEDLVGQVVPVTIDPHRLDGLREVYVKAQVHLDDVRTNPNAPKTDLLSAREAVYRTRALYEEAKAHTAELEWVDGLLIRLMRGDPEFEFTVFLADEINFAPAKIMALCNGVCDDRRQVAIVQHSSELITAHPGFHFAAAMNPNYEGTRKLNKAFADRFHLQVDFGYDDKVEAELIQSSSLLTMSRKLRESHRNGTLETPVSTRTMLQFEELARVFNAKIAIESLVARFEETDKAAVREVAQMHLRGGSAGRGASTTPFGDATS